MSAKRGSGRATAHTTVRAHTTLVLRKQCPLPCTRVHTFHLFFMQSSVEPTLSSPEKKSNLIRHHLLLIRGMVYLC